MLTRKTGLTDHELKIMKVIWERGSATVRDVIAGSLGRSRTSAGIDTRELARRSRPSRGRYRCSDRLVDRRAVATAPPPPSSTALLSESLPVVRLDQLQVPGTRGSGIPTRWRTLGRYSRLGSFLRFAFCPDLTTLGADSIYNETRT
jgi:hypothetical protein